MYSMILMAALSGNVEMPACHRRRWTPCYPVYYTCYPVYYTPCVYYVYPSATVAQAETSSEEEAAGEEEESDAPLTAAEEKEFQEYIKEATPEEKAQLTTNAAKRTLIKEVRKALKANEGKGGTDEGGKGDKGDKGDTGGDGQGALPAPAMIRVHLPADATLTIAGEATASASSLRRFISPPLPPGRDYTYELKATVQRDGKAVTRAQRVTVRAGEETEVRFDDVPAVSVARN